MKKRIGIAAAASLSALAIAGIAPPGASAAVNISGATPDATSVYFSSDERLVAADTDSLFDIYSSSAGVVSLVSAPGVGASGSPGGAGFGGASADGTKVFFVTTENLVTADTDGLNDVYERSGGTTTLISVPGVGSSGAPAATTFARASADGSKVFFLTNENLVAADTDGFQDVYERSGGTTTLISVEGVGSSGSPTGVSLSGISSDGSKVFLGTVEKFIAGDTDANVDFFERSGGTTSWITAPEAGGAATIGTPNFGGVSADGSKVFFTTEDALVAGDTDGVFDDVYERSGGTTTLISEPGVGGSGPANNSSFSGASADGSKVFFNSQEDLVTADADGMADIYERSAGTTTLISAPGAGATPPATDVFYGGNSSDGSAVFFDTDENMVAADTDGFFDVYKRTGGTTSLATPEGAGASGPFSDASTDAVSADGSVLLFETEQNMVGADTDGAGDVYQNSGGVTTLVSAPGTGANGPGTDDLIFRRSSADGSRVIFSTTERMTGADGDNSIGDLYQRFTGTTTLISGELGPPLGSPPDTSITSGPPASTTDTTASFTFTANEGPPVSPVTFECHIDGAAFAPCTSPQVVSGLGLGGHTFEVRATDFALNVDPTPASITFTVTSAASPPPPSVPTAPAKKHCKKGQKLKKGKCVKKKHRK
jgi:hypothetical protein